MPKPKLKYRELSNQVSFMTKTKQDNNVIDYTGAFYAENDIELS